MKVCLSRSLKQFEHSSDANLVPIKISIIIIAGLDKLPGKDISHIDNVANCQSRDGRHGKDWSKEEEQKFLALGGVLLMIFLHSTPNIPHGHGDENYAEDDSSPYQVAVVDESFAGVNISANVRQKEPKAWLIESKKKK